MPGWDGCLCRRVTPLPDHHYFVYVIELAKEALPWPLRTETCSPQCVYVGESWHTPACRFAQHRAGYMSSPRPRNHGIRVLPELYEWLNPLQSQHEALEAERQLAAALRKEGLHVYMGQ